MELEVRLKELARVELGLDHNERNRRAMRQQQHDSLIRMESGNWLETQAVSEWLVWERVSVNEERQRKLEEVDNAKDEYLERRKGYLQIQSVIEAGITAETIRRSRREQQELDDWFGQRNHANVSRRAR